MKTAGGSEAAKRNAGEAAAAAVEAATLVGLGTGSTAAFAIRAIGRAVEDGLDVRGVPTSFAARELAREVGVPLVDLDAIDRIDLAIDGADQIVLESGAAIKGGGAAHAREKVVAAAADELAIVVDPSKTTETLDRAVPIEVLPDARTTVSRQLEAIGGDSTLRTADRKDGPVVTDNGNLVIDCSFGPIDDPGSLARTLSGVPGIVEHGLFVDLVDRIYVGTADDVEVTTV